MVKGIFIGAMVGCVLCAVAGWLLGGVMGALVSLPSMGSPDLMRSEGLRLAAYGMAVGVIIGSAVGAICAATGGDMTGTLDVGIPHPPPPAP